MHEFSIAMSIVDIATEYAQREEARVVKEIEIEVGELSGVVPDALEFSLESAVKDTILENARRVIITIRGIALCTSCHEDYETSSLFKACPSCRACAPDIIQGRELRVKSLIVE